MAESQVDEVRILIGADDEILDWKAMRITASVPMNRPVRPFLEHSIMTKTKWSDLSGMRVYTADGKGIENVRATADLFQLNLTPHQLRMAPGTFHWAWLKRSDAEADEGLLTADEMFRSRVEHIYRFYAPDKARTVDTVLADFRGREDLLIAKLCSRYGPEPTKEQLVKARIVRPNGDTAPSPPPGPGAELGPRATSLADPQFAMVASMFSRSSVELFRRNVYFKWQKWVQARREQRRIAAFMTGKMDAWLRRSYFSRWSTNAVALKSKRQMATSTKLAYQQESMVSALQEENLHLKEETRRLQSNVEVLEASNARRYETLFASSEQAVTQIKMLTREVHAKERALASLETQMMKLGSQLLAAREEKDQAEKTGALELAKAQRALEESDERALKAEAAHRAALDEIERLQPRTPPRSCEHCPHYDEAVRAAEALRRNTEVLREKLVASEGQREQLQAQVQEMALRPSPFAPHPEPDPSAPEPGAPPNHSFAAGALPNQSFAAPNQSFFNAVDALGAARNVSFYPGMLEADTDTRTESGVAHDARTTVTAPRNTSMAMRSRTEASMGPAPSNAPTSPPPAATAATAAAATAPSAAGPGIGLPPGVLPSSAFIADPVASLMAQARAPPRVESASLSNFFGREEAIGHDRFKLMLDRQLGARQPGAAAARLAPKAPQPSLIGAPTVPGLPGAPMPTAPVPHDAPDVLGLPAGRRHPVDPPHATFAAGEHASAKVMRAHLFSLPT